MQKDDALKMLDLLDDYRRTHQEQIDDYSVRIACALIAQQAGYKSRSEWCKDLMNDNTTLYSAYINGATIL